MSAVCVGVVGASARAAVHSLARAGRTAWAVDLFGDRDLRLVAPCAVCPIDDYPAAIPAIAAQFPPGPFIYTGGLENHPDIVAELAATRELIGTPAAALARVRDPYQLSQFGFAQPRLVPPGEPCPATGRWLRKPLHSSGGRGIRFAHLCEAPSAAHFFQEFVPGTPVSAVFRDGALLGITEQLVGTQWLHARDFQYAGNIGLAEVTPPLRAELASLGRELASTLGLRDIFGVDFILDEERAWLIEVNPRYPASAEVIEHATNSGRVIGKAIFYAPRAITFPASGPWDRDLAEHFDPWRLPAFADIPELGSRIESGWPVLTVFTAGSSPTECRERLQSRAAELDELLGGCPP